MGFDLFSSHLFHSPSSSLGVNMSFYCESPATIINNQVHLIPENHHNRNRVNNLTYQDPMYSIPSIPSIPPIPPILNRPVSNQSTNCLPYNHHHHHHHLNVTSPLVYNQQQRFQHHPNQYYGLNYQLYPNYQSYHHQQQQHQHQPQQYHPHPHPHPHQHQHHNQYPKKFGDNFQLYHNLNQQQFNYNESPMDVNNFEINCVEVEINNSSNEAHVYSVETDDGQKVDPLPPPTSSSSNQNVLPEERQREYHYGSNNDNDQVPASNCNQNDDKSDGIPEDILEIIESLEAERAAINTNRLRSVSPSVF